METEGVIKFQLSFERTPARPVNISALMTWREILRRLGLIGQDPQRYHGLGFGNLSMRTKDGFLVSGSQTGHIGSPGVESYSEVFDWQLEDNHVAARGPVEPSSESLTHAAVYDCVTAANFVFHVHSPSVWRSAADMSIPKTGAGIEYGTPAMAREVLRVCKQQVLPGAFVMAGHQDGVVCYGNTAMETGMRLVNLLAESLTND